MREYIYLNGTPLVLIDHRNNQVGYYHTDHLGTPQLVTGNNQQILWQASYTPFGRAQVLIENITQPLRFPGQYFDSETGLHYNYFRDYDPNTGRYIQSDPLGTMREGGNPQITLPLLLGFIADWNLTFEIGENFNYVKNSPVMSSDPYGLIGLHCSRPLGVFGGGSPEKKSGSHEFLCVTLPSGKMICDSNNANPNNNPLIPHPGIPSKPEDDNPDNSECREIDDDSDRCFENCVIKEFKKPRPLYQLLNMGGVNCQDYTKDVISMCKTTCP